MTRRIDWDTVRASYVEGAVKTEQDPYERTWPSLATIATLFGVNLSHLKRRSTVERWTDLRDAYQRELDRERRRALLDARVGQAVKVDGHALTAAEAGIALVGRRLSHLVQRSASDGSSVDDRELATLGLAARRWMQVKAQVMGEPTTGDDLEGDDDDKAAAVIERVLAARIQEHVAARKAIDVASVVSEVEREQA